MPPVTPDSVLGECHAAGLSGLFLLEQHAVERALQRNIGRLDVRNALREATGAALQHNGRWCVTGGVALDGEPVTLIVRVDRGLVIVTLY